MCQPASYRVEGAAARRRPGGSLGISRKQKWNGNTGLVASSKTPSTTVVAMVIAPSSGTPVEPCTPAAAAALFLAAAAASLTTASAGGGGQQQVGGTETVHLPHYVFGNTTVNYTYASVMFIGIIAVSILLERAMIKLNDVSHDEPHYSEMVKKIFGELTILGCLSFVLTLVREIARESSGSEKIPAYQLVSFELAHILIFIVAMVYVATAVVVVLTLRKTKRRWDIVQFQDVDSVIEEGNSANIQCKFFHLLTSQQYGLGFYFDFARYSYLVMSEKIGELLEIDTLTWLVVLACNLIFLLTRLVSGANCEWNYVYNHGEPCDDEWSSSALSNENTTNNRSSRILGSVAVADDDAHGGGGSDDASTRAPLVYGSFGHEMELMEDTLLTFSAGPLIAIISFGWLLMGLMYFGEHKASSSSLLLRSRAHFLHGRLSQTIDLMFVCCV